MKHVTSRRRALASGKRTSASGRISVRLREATLRLWGTRFRAREQQKSHGNWNGTNGTVTNGAVNFAQICVNFAKTISQMCAMLRKFCANFAQTLPISRKFGKFCMFPHLFDLHPRLLHHRLFSSNPRIEKSCTPSNQFPYTVVAISPFVAIVST